MEKLASNETASSFTKLGLYQFAGGVIGVFIILWNMFHATALDGPILGVDLLVLLFFAYSIFCGTLCLKTKKSALGYSLINQFLQIIGFALLGFGFRYASGVYLTVGLDLTDSIKFGLGAGISSFTFNFNMEPERLEVDINLVAIAIIYWIDNLMKKVKEEAKLRQAALTAIT